jgi:hypothetical protein
MWIPLRASYLSLTFHAELVKSGSFHKKITKLITGQNITTGLGRHTLAHRLLNGDVLLGNM